MDNSRTHPGNANLQIGVRGEAIREYDAHRKIYAGSTEAVSRAIWLSRGYLPHFESASAVQHVTFHLADSLPNDVLLRLAKELESVPAEKRDAERRKRVDAWIDAGHGSCILCKPQIAAIVQGSILAFDSKRYRLLAWVVMPNHVHALLQPVQEWTIAKIVASWKKFTAQRICRFRRENGKGSGGPVWHREYWDRFIRNRGHFEQAIDYIHLNPVKAGLVGKAQDWVWSSAHSEGSGRFEEV